MTLVFLNRTGLHRIEEDVMPLEIDFQILMKDFQSRKLLGKPRVVVSAL